MSRTLTIALSLISLTISCSGGSSVRYDWNGNSGFPVEETARSKEPIDNYPAQEIFFSLTAPEETVSITITGNAPTGFITGERREVPLYFIVEREIAAPSGSVFTEIGRNFTRAWDQKKNLTLYSDNRIPFIRLDPGVFRIRFTSFDTTGYKIAIEAGAAHPIAFSAVKPVKEIK